MRADNINPRTGLVVALVSVFLVFGFMFTVSGVRGETLGDIPLIAIGPAIFLPGLAAILLAKKTDGFSKWPAALCCGRDRRDTEGELLAAPSIGGSWQDMSKTSTRTQTPEVEEGGFSVDSRSLIRKSDQEAARRYLETYYPSGVFNNYCAFARLCSNRDSAFYTSVYSTRDSVVYSPRDSVPYGRYYCCYPSPGETQHVRLCWDYETIV
ncbi:transmembrane protein 215-like [Chiloscyllium plagiosum]|uniref:transmembrane protein 215-like n=1 Tax=Chiloscyllium plagiosum TaxID=36176 RepID=UPI001CB7B1C5|nr:transmembrane protein 215-like [Chiloscyllium plagiosum]